MTETTASEPVLVDSWGWLEYLTEDTLAQAFEPYLLAEERLIPPTIVIYEVPKKLLSLDSPGLLDRFLSRALRTQIVPLDKHLALAAAQTSLRHKLAMADAIVYATAQSRQAELVTGDSHFRNLPGVTLL